MIPKISLDSRFDESNKINKQSQQMTNNIVINSNLPTTITSQPEQPENNVVYMPPPQNLYNIPEVQVVGSELDNILKENKQLRAESTAQQIIFEMIKTNPIYINKLILVDDEKLIKLLKLFTESDEVTLDINEDISSCCGFNNTDYRYVNTIYVKKNGKIENLKYSYPEVVKRITDLGINL